MGLHISGHILDKSEEDAVAKVKLGSGSPATSAAGIGLTAGIGSGTIGPVPLASDPSNPQIGLDPSITIDSHNRVVTTNVAVGLDDILPGEAALVYQSLKDQLANLFGEMGHHT